MNNSQLILEFGMWSTANNEPKQDEQHGRNLSVTSEEALCLQTLSVLMTTPSPIPHIQKCINNYELLIVGSSVQLKSSCRISTQTGPERKKNYNHFVYYRDSSASIVMG